MIKKQFIPIILSTLFLSSCGNNTNIQETYSPQKLVIAHSEDDTELFGLLTENYKKESEYSIEEKIFSSTDLLTMALLSGFPDGRQCLRRGQKLLVVVEGEVPCRQPIAAELDERCGD